ncbi:uncharacterized protein LOC133855028 isoform X2 [Alnus glutinosa]|uniref:uncharacterized protein LOC133855028 isoform X2 n=1 Tax=Alnus glutinosa TaxID=3517 RepID=UPI002D797817|nr:uncharacterized protein LOC133855028 isoform X2 [Alnus glutinosa]
MGSKLCLVHSKSISLSVVQVMENVIKASWNVCEVIESMSEWVEVHLCEAYAQFLCDGIGTVWVREDDVWKELDGHELMKNVGLDSATYMYTKQRAMDAVGRLLETRRNPHG